MKSVYERKKELLKKSKALKEIAFDLKDNEKSIELRKKQDDCYKRYMFMKNLTNAMGGVK